MNRKIKNVIFLMFFLVSGVVFSQEGYNENYQIKKINNELKKHYDNSNSSKFYYELMSIRKDTLRVKKFSYLPGSKRLHIWDELYVPMTEVDVSSIKYKKGILIKIKGKKKLIGDYLNKKANAKKYFGFKIHPQAGKKKDKEIMEMLIDLFKKH